MDKLNSSRLKHSLSFFFSFFFYTLSETNDLAGHEAALLASRAIFTPILGTTLQCFTRDLVQWILSDKFLAWTALSFLCWGQGQDYFQFYCEMKHKAQWENTVEGKYVVILYLGCQYLPHISKRYLEIKMSQTRNQNRYWRDLYLV